MIVLERGRDVGRCPRWNEDVDRSGDLLVDAPRAGESAWRREDEARSAMLGGAHDLLVPLKERSESSSISSRIEAEYRILRFSSVRVETVSTTVSCDTTLLLGVFCDFRFFVSRVISSLRSGASFHSSPLSSEKTDGNEILVFGRIGTASRSPYPSGSSETSTCSVEPLARALSSRSLGLLTFISVVVVVGAIGKGQIDVISCRRCVALARSSLLWYSGDPGDEAGWEGGGVNGKWWFTSFNVETRDDDRADSRAGS